LARKATANGYKLRRDSDSWFVSPSEDTKGAFTTVEVVADHRNGVQTHIHQKEEEHFIILEGMARVACGDRMWDAAAGMSFTVDRVSPMPGAIRPSPASNVCHFFATH
jgi:mannose-6-phosphate isomerase-like protein (cupin superfamily)